MNPSDKEKFQADLKEANETATKGAAELNKEENQKKQDQYFAEKLRDRQLRYAKELSELRNEHKTISKFTGKESTKWEDLEMSADKAINSEANTTIDWRSAMMSILNMCSDLNDAASTSRRQTIGEALNYVGEKIGTTTPVSLGYNKLKSKLLYAIKGNGDFKIPTLQHKVTFKDGKVERAPLTRADGVPMKETQDDGTPVMSTNRANNAFELFVNLWLQENGYTLRDPNKPGEYVDVNGAVLDEAKFNTLKADPDKGLEKFLTKHAELSYEALKEDPSTQSTPSAPTP